MKYLACTLRGTRVLALCDDRGNLSVDGEGRVEIRYRLDDERVYRALARNLIPIKGEMTLLKETDKSRARSPKSPDSYKTRLRDITEKPQVAITPSKKPIIVYTDGACSGNPGPAGLGVVIKDGVRCCELSQYLGSATNNVAELMAIKQAAEAIEDPTRPVRMYTDSRYCIGVLEKSWKAKANRELISNIKSLLADFCDLEFIYTKGHAGDPLNERADTLAREAVRTRSSLGWIEI